MTLQQHWRALKAWGWPGAAALVCLALAATAWAYEAHCQELDRQASAQVAQLNLRLQSLATRPDTAPTQTRTDWLASLPAAEARQRRLADLLEVAIREGVNVPHTEHKLAVDSATGLERLRISMPVQGSYAQIRQFIGVALLQDPALSLDSLRLHRPSPQVSQVDAELVWSLHGRVARDGP